MAILCNGKELPITIAINHKNRYDMGDKTFTEIYPYDAYIKQDSYIELYEGLNTGIKFFADSLEHFDQDARIEIQTSLYDSSDTQKKHVYPLTLEPTLNWIYNHGDDIFPWRMGTYLIHVYYQGQTYTVGFFVRPLYLSTEQVNSIHHYLESKIEGMIYDLISSNESLMDQEDKTLSNWYYDYARYMTSQKETIYYFLLSLENLPLSHIISSNEVSLTPGKVNRRSIKWSTTNKGIAKNSGIGEETYYYNQVKKVNYNQSANRWMKNILSNWSSDLNHVIKTISKSRVIVQKKLYSLENKVFSLYERKDYLNTRREVSTTTKIDISSQISIIEKEIQKHKGILAKQDFWIVKLSSIFSRMVYLLNNSFLKEIDRGKIKPVLKNNNYYQLNSIYDKSKLFQQAEGDNKQIVKILKPFWQIYEYFCLFTVIDCLKKIGFRIKKGFEPNFVELYHQSLIPPGTFFELENEKAIIHCWYDKYHGDKFSAEEKGELFFAGQEKKRPDIKLDLYEKQENGDLLFRSSLIFDAKFRKLANMHNNDYATTTYQQLTSYYNFFYLGSNRKSQRGQVVHQVICLYGSEKGKKVKKTVEPLLYIKLFPKIEENGEINTIGENEVLEELHYWLEDLILSPLD
ncbi:hypothetical protein I33_4188 [Bacillus subtilis subsp. subtilis str. RO-NN-1]|uniref:nuclease domain-containing protein n=1 Tax=Bacillus subtilis TaxID=1423 RepID=UPI00022BAB7D|nr:hypothetical protein [Bacillus subtilis]AEP93090.1 hypothetical protein I33_4188 [Bacillus subtilis subsp. subtilis str. RO-NN-1]UVZ57957.1 hypothetical protein NYR91_20175 [Bacillus subtilis]